MDIDVAQFFGAVIEAQGGEITISYDALEKMEGDKAISIDLEEREGEQVLVFRLMDSEDIIYADS